MGPTNTSLHREFAFLALAGTIWGLQPLLVKFLVRDIPPSSLSAARFFLVALTIFLGVGLMALTHVGTPPKSSAR